MIYTIFALFVLYTIACCMDGQDLKPIWKRWLGLRLELMANNLHPIDYCVRDKCKYYHRAMYDFPMVHKQYESLLSEVSRRNALNSHPVILLGGYEQKIIEKKFMLDEVDLYDAYLQ